MSKNYLSNDGQEIAEALGIKHLEELFSSIPKEVRGDTASTLESPLSERQIKEIASQIENDSFTGTDFTGYGAYRHDIPEAVNHLAAQRGFVTAYTPYQAEVAQGILQALFEYQSMTAQLASMDLANGSLYDGATAMIEAVRMAIRENKKGAKKSNGLILYSAGIHPETLKVMETYFSKAVLEQLEIELVEVPLDPQSGDTDWEGWSKENSNKDKSQPLIVVLQSPNYLGIIEESAKTIRNIFPETVICYGTMEPHALALLPDTPDSIGAEIVWGEAQPLGIPLSFGGPGLGFLACKEKYMRQMPGRLVGQTEALDSKGEKTPAYVITLSTREQHIRREKATSNICSNQTLMAIRSSIYMAAKGWKGLQETALECTDLAQYFLKSLPPEAGTALFEKGNSFHEVAWRPANIETLFETCAKLNIIPGKIIEFQGEPALLTYFSELQKKESIDLLIVAAFTQPDLQGTQNTANGAK